MVEWYIMMEHNKSQISCALIHLYAITKHEKVSNTKQITIHTNKEYYSATKRNKLLFHASRWIYIKI